MAAGWLPFVVRSAALTLLMMQTFHAACSMKVSDADGLADLVIEQVSAARARGGGLIDVRFVPERPGDYVLVILPDAEFDEPQLIRSGLPAEEARALLWIHGRRKPGGTTLAMFQGARFSTVDHVGDYLVVDRPSFVQKRSRQEVVVNVSVATDRARLVSIS